MESLCLTRNAAKSSVSGDKELSVIKLKQDRILKHYNGVAKMTFNYDLKLKYSETICQKFALRYIIETYL